MKFTSSIMMPGNCLLVYKWVEVWMCIHSHYISCTCQEKENSIRHEDLGRDITTVQTLQRKHEAFEHELEALGNQVRTASVIQVHTFVYSLQMCVHMWALCAYVFSYTIYTYRSEILVQRQSGWQHHILVTMLKPSQLSRMRSTQLGRVCKTPLWWGRRN